MTALLLAFLACKSDNPTGETDPATPVDLTERLDAGQVRAGVITDESALFGGVSAEGEIGDFKIYNDRAQFVIQGQREGSYYVQIGGGVIDADIVRPEGQIGRDFVEEWGVMLGFGRLMYPDQIEVISDGADGEAIIRVTGSDVPVALFRGAIESDALFPSQGLQAVTEYRLAPDSWLLEVTTTVTATEPVPGLQIGDVLMGAPELADNWRSGTGFETTDEPRSAAGYIGHRNDGAVGILGKDGPLVGALGADLIGEFTDAVVGFGAAASLEAGESSTFTRYYGVAPDFAVLTDAALGGEVVSGEVTAPDGPVPGARVHVFDGTDVHTIAITDASGAYSARVPDESRAEVRVDGRGRSLFFDLPEGFAPWPAFASEPVMERAHGSMTDGAPDVPLAQGRGFAPAGSHALGQPGTVTIQLTDGLPFTARLGPGAPDDQPASISRGRPNGLAAAGWSRGGDLVLSAEPGTYDLLIHRGMRYELHTETIEVVAGDNVVVTTALEQAYDHDGYILGDPHAHASPSGDGSVSMEERIMVTAAGGIQLHFGSDHDRVADYRPLVRAMGLEPILRSVVADEVSSVLRGHINTYPLEPDPSAPNHGAVPWWTSIPTSTQSLSDTIRDTHGEVVVQANHPTDNGVADAAGWVPGNVGNADFWVDDLDAIEVLNDGSHGDFFPVYLDLVNRGYLTTPVGVSDSHSHFQATPGINGTYIGIGSNDVSSYSDAGLLDAYAQHKTIASLGVFLDMSIEPGTTLTSPTTLQVTAQTPSWITVDRLKLLVNGVETQVIEDTSGSFAIEAAQDATFIVVAEGDTPMQPVTNRRPWATHAAILFDADNNGWSAPLPPLQVE